MPDHPMHGDVWAANRMGGKFSVMHVCGHHDPPRVTGYWHDDDGVNPDRHGAIPLPTFLRAFQLIDREFLPHDNAPKEPR